MCVFYTFVHKKGGCHLFSLQIITAHQFIFAQNTGKCFFLFFFQKIVEKLNNRICFYFLFCLNPLSKFWQCLVFSIKCTNLHTFLPDIEKKLNWISVKDAQMDIGCKKKKDLIKAVISARDSIWPPDSLFCLPGPITQFICTGQFSFSYPRISALLLLHK